MRRNFTLLLMIVLGCLLMACPTRRGGGGGGGGSDDDDSGVDDDDTGSDDDDVADDDDDVVTDDDDDVVTDDDDASGPVSGSYEIEFDLGAPWDDSGYYDCTATHSVNFVSYSTPGGCSGCEYSWHVDLPFDYTDCAEGLLTEEDIEDYDIGVGGGLYYEYYSVQGAWNALIEGSQGSGYFVGSSDWLQGDEDGTYSVQIHVDLSF
jgi:hypothetical protein